MSTENATGAEVLALKAIARLLLAEKIREYKDEAAAAFEFASICSGIMNKSATWWPRSRRYQTRGASAFG